MSDRISLASKVVADRSADEVIDIAGRLGFGGIEWFCMPQHLPADTSPARARELAARTRDAGHATVCLSTYVGGFADVDDAEAARQLEALDRYLALADTFDCPVLRVWPDTMGKKILEDPTDAQIERAATWLARCTDRAAASGRTIGLEMHLALSADVAILDRLFAQVDRPNLAAIYDPGNICLAKLPHGADVVRRLGSRIVHVQLKDVSRSRPTPAHLAGEPTVRYGGDFDLLFGEGELDLPPILAALDEVGYQGWFSVECHALPRPNLDSAAIAAHDLAYIRSALRAASGDRVA